LGVTGLATVLVLAGGAFLGAGGGANRWRVARVWRGDTIRAAMGDVIFLVAFGLVDFIAFTTFSGEPADKNSFINTHAFSTRWAIMDVCC